MNRLPFRSALKLQCAFADNEGSIFPMNAPFPNPANSERQIGRELLEVIERNGWVGN